MNLNRNLPTGTRDKLFREAHVAYKIEQQVNQYFEARGFKRIETPVIEFADVFSSENQADTKLYRFFDEKGRLTVLRPDMTLPIGRVVSTTGVTLPLKLSYSGKIFRANDDFGGEQNEQTQAGIELIGYPSIKAEIECILSGIGVLNELQIPNFQIELGHAAIYRRLIHLLHLSETTEMEFRLLIQNKSLTGIQAFVTNNPSSLDDFILALPRLFGPATTILAQAKKLTTDQGIIAALTEIETIVKAVHYAADISVDLGLVQDLHYYTGIIFRGYAELAADNFLNGGRYDHLLEQFTSSSSPAVGLALNLDLLTDLQNHAGIFKKQAGTTLLIHYDLAALPEAEKLMQQTPNSELSFFEEAANAISFAKKWKIPSVVHVSTEGITTIFGKEAGQ
ncbi:ATP phosphoribosyltransferase regulatory subunit [Listeria ivanovii]|uniref:ATP phosphoribosyltransferase regulatory subunit n=1 Tax=Listeria ivanovii (strain ATCC BAA-678 / PAM 55) TaxID=881621 RepID=G2ZBV8_LISIP|nr:ATP phosphoribosyltransferase regulatory subunit [Listeria ivanovii]AHI55082.1 ATP phosphoribosyltransferase [Listeria ivanovii WSLC3009]AIS64541.1 ATP phosphoribosyltransferase [Listeria ivanovii subsp. ivanovii]MBC1758788.1 ATP phosphoribosyltransferase regulatory subunit [Listeria ivanovii]MBK3913646.1 ATP phosphoribosyltransferase regulatory subunit [Listeria ivanovii subsp. ivanovii]MBK3920236.1 ATP phosphoribosyltransferase regulatory subunit [Listeria ivanovii subsp. ivanovii]